jgi:hypothetical protein
VQLVYFDAGWSPVRSLLEGYSGRVPTVGMNYITSDRAYCLFPRMTFVGQIMCSSGNHTPQESEAVAKYERRGWRLVDWKEEFEALRLQRGRRVGDSMTWVVPFNCGFSERTAEDDEFKDIRFALRQHSVVLLRKRC